MKVLPKLCDPWLCPVSNFVRPDFCMKHQHWLLVRIGLFTCVGSWQKTVTFSYLMLFSIIFPIIKSPPRENTPPRKTRMLRVQQSDPAWWNDTSLVSGNTPSNGFHKSPVTRRVNCVVYECKGWECTAAGIQKNDTSPCTSVRVYQVC